MGEPATETVRVSRRFEAPADTLFDAWIEPRVAGEWLFATPNGQIVRTDIDARVGGEFTIADRRDGEAIERVGKYLVIDRPHRLVFTFGVPRFSTAFTQVSIDLFPRGMGCELTLTHDGVLSEWASRTESGWKMLLAGLANVVEKKVHSAT